MTVGRRPLLLVACALVACVRYGFERADPVGARDGGPSDGSAPRDSRSRTEGGPAPDVELHASDAARPDALLAKDLALQQADTAPPDLAARDLAARDLAVSPCGNGTREPGEGCDDGNRVASDGCDERCRVEPGWWCSASSAVCVREPGVEFVRLEPGTFLMGSPTSESGRESDEVQHSVTLSRSFWIQTSEIRQEQFEAITGWNPADFGPNGTQTECGASCPAERVSWFDVVAYANLRSSAEGLPRCYAMSQIRCEDGRLLSGERDCLNGAQGGIDSATVALSGGTVPYECLGYRLPTEAEWEYAARAGDSRATYNGSLPSSRLECQRPNTALDSISWFCGNSSNRLHPARSLQANSWGLFDMLGSVYEFCWDWYETALSGPVTDPVGAASGTRRAARGGSWLSYASTNRAAMRGPATPNNRDNYVGGRLVRTVP